MTVATAESPAIRRLKDEIKTHLQEIAKISDTATAAGRDYTDDERAAVAVLMGKAGEIRAALQKAKADDVTRAAIAELGDEVGLNEGDPAEKSRERREDAGRAGWGNVAASKSRGEHFTESAAYRDLLKQAGPSGIFGEKQRVQSAPEGFANLLPERGRKALVTGSGDVPGAGALVDPQHLGLIFGPEEVQRPLGMRDLVTAGRTDTDTIDFVKIAGFTNAAAVVPEATATTGTSGIKPESGFTFSRDSTQVRTIAHWIPVTKRALSDAAQIRTIIDNFLLYGLDAALEMEMIAGDGTGEHFLGLNSISGTQSQDVVADPAGKPAGFGNLLALRRAKTKVRLYGGGIGAGQALANGYVMHPLDREMLDEISDGQGQFYGGGPFGSNDTTGLWGLPVVENENMTRGTAWCADWRWAVLYDREQANISVSDSHDNFFIRNMVAVLAELRAAFAVLKPPAFVEVALNLPVETP